MLLLRWAGAADSSVLCTLICVSSLARSCGSLQQFSDLPGYIARRSARAAAFPFPLLPLAAAFPLPLAHLFSISFTKPHTGYRKCGHFLEWPLACKTSFLVRYFRALCKAAVTRALWEQQLGWWRPSSAVPSMLPRLLWGWLQEGHLPASRRGL